MQSKSKSKRLSLKITALFFVVMVLAYLPVSSFLFFLKNDAFNGYFPSRFFISETIHAKSFPWWNPYINFGLPQYGDMNAGFWSPITWLVAYAFQYNAYTFTIELLFYLMISGIGFFNLCRFYKQTKTASLISGIAYMCCGYMVGHLQHFNWISAAAFLPWCIWAYNNLHKKFSMKNSIICSLLFYMLIASAHPGLIIGSMYFFAAYIIFIFMQKRKLDGEDFSVKSFVRKNLWMFGLLFMLCLGLIAGYADLLPNITRGEKLAGAASITNPVTLQSFISVLIPMSTAKAGDFFNTDISMRNLYFGLVPLIFFIMTISGKKSSEQKFFLYAGLFFFILSLGGIFKYLSYYVLPGMAYVRLSGEFAIFSMLSIILSMSFTLNEHIVSNKNFHTGFYKPFYVLQLLLMAAVITGIAGALISHKGLFFAMQQILSQPSTKMKLKSLLDSLSFFDILWIQACVQFVFLNHIKKALQKKHFHHLIKICAADLIIAALLNIPFTGVGQASVKDVQTQLNRVPEGLPAPFLQPISSFNTEDSKNYFSLLGDVSFYNKQIGTVNQAFYPVELKNSKNVFKNNQSLFADKPFLFTTGNDNSTIINIKYFKGNLIELELDSKGNEKIVYQQNHYPKWRMVVNGERKKPEKYAGVFMATNLSQGKNYIKFNFFPGFVYTALKISVVFFAASLLYLIIVMFKRRYP